MSKSRTLKVTVLTAPSVSFPFPGMPEINVIALVKDPDADEEDGDRYDKLKPVILNGKSIPTIGEVIEVTEYYEYYLIGQELIPSGGAESRLSYAK